MLKKRALVALAAFAAAGLPLSALNTIPAAASSHREAPLTSQDPTADGTDVYAFTPADNANSVTFVANFNPFQFAAGGPNFYRFGDDVKYQIHLDLNGQGTDGVTLSFNFKTNTNNDQTFLYNTGAMSVQDPTTAPVPAGGQQFNHYKNFNRPQVYQVTLDPRGSGITQCQSPAVTAAGAFFSPPTNVGPRSVSDYHSLANAAIQTLTCSNGDGNYPPIKVFAGQRSDPFFVDLGGAFDLLGLGAGQNVLTGLNVGSIVVNVPKVILNNNLGANQVATTGNNPQPAQPIVGVWSSASRNKTTTINADGTRTASDATQVQVSRLGMPLVNEAVVQLKYKDVFNSTQPSGDGGLPADFKARVFAPELAGLFRALKLDPNAPLTNRQDIAATFLQGLDALKTHPRNASIAEELRYNYSSASGTAAANENRLGPLGGDTNADPGFPQGRRLLDDVVDIELLAIQGILCDPAHISTFDPQFSAQATALGAPHQGQCRSDNVVPGGNGLGDGVNKPDKQVQDVFPYLADPTQG